MASILRILSGSMPRGVLKTKPVLRKRFSAFLGNTQLYLRQIAPVGIYDYVCGTAPESLGEIQHLCFCLCIVAANSGPELALSAPEGLPTELRRSLFLLFCQWCSPGPLPGSSPATVALKVTKVHLPLHH